MATSLPITRPTLSRARLARLFSFVQESPVGSNKGRWVEALQRIGGTDPGQPWCACLVTAVLDMYFDGKSPFPATASCEQLRQLADNRGWLTRTPHDDDIFLVLNQTGVAHHTGIVASVSPDYATIVEVSGNTNDDGSREGYGVFELTRSVTPLLAFIHIPDTGRTVASIRTL